MTFTREFARALTEKRPAQTTLFTSGMQLQIHKLPQICSPSSLACLRFKALSLEVAENLLDNQ